MHQDRKEDMMMAITNVANARSRMQDSSDVTVRSSEDMIRVTRVPGTMDILVDMLYYDIRSPSYESEEMSV